MSKIALAPNASGTGTFSIASPNSNTDRTLTLPDVTGTILTGSGAIGVNASAPTNSLAVDASGNVGIGTSSPTQQLHISGPSPRIEMTDTDTGADCYVSAASGTGALVLSADENNEVATSVMAFRVDGAERIRIDSAGNFLVGTTAQFNSCKQGLIFDGATNIGFAVKNSNAATGQVFVGFYNSAGTNIGTITQNATTTVAYNTSSDYRLKENIVPMTGALSKVALLKPVTYSWKQEFGGEDGQGFIAHELQEIVPDCVTGAKDAVDADGSPKYQGIDTSFLVATLTAAIQELKAIVDAQGAEIATLKGTA